MTTLRGTLGLGPSPAPTCRDGSTWKLDAACRDEDPEAFFHPEGERGSERHKRDRAAVAICNRCPVRDACLADNLAVADAASEYGVIGGLTEEQRLPLIRAARKEAAQRRRAARGHGERCGTVSGYNDHLLSGQPTCGSCRAAVRERERERRSSGKRACTIPGCETYARGAGGLCHRHMKEEAKTS